MYEAGSIDRPDKGKVKVIDPRVLAREQKKDFQISRASRLRYRTRYFTDSGVIGSKEFVSFNYQRFKHLFATRHERKIRACPFFPNFSTMTYLCILTGT